MIATAAYVVIFIVSYLIFLPLIGKKPQTVKK